MGFYDVGDRLAWWQAVRFLNVSKSAFYRLAARGEFKAYGGVPCGGVVHGRFYLKSELEAYLRRKAKAERGKGADRG